MFEAAVHQDTVLIVHWLLKRNIELGTESHLLEERGSGFCFSACDLFFSDTSAEICLE